MSKEQMSKEQANLRYITFKKYQIKFLKVPMSKEQRN